MKKAIQINAKLGTLEYVLVGDNFTDIYPFIGEQCTTFSCPVTFENNDTLYVDDEGLYNDYKYGFAFNDWSYPILGNGLILGTDDEGNSVDCKFTIEDFKDRLYFGILTEDGEYYHKSIFQSTNNLI